MHEAWHGDYFRVSCGNQNRAYAQRFHGIGNYIPLCFFFFSIFYHSFCDLLVHPNMMMDVGFGMYQTQ